MAVMLSNLPELIFEVAWTSTPFETAPVWVDESAYVRVNPQVNIRRGRQSELDEFSYGTMTIELSNRDRRFDPTYSAGALYGNLLPRKQCRFRLKWSGTTYDVFKGWITNLPQNYAAGGVDATVTLEAVDSLAMLAEMGLDLDPLADFIDTNANYTSLHSFDGSNWLSHQGTVSGTLTSGVATFGPPLDPISGNSSAHLGGFSRWTVGSATTTPGLGSHTVSMWVQVASGDDVSAFTFIDSGDAASFVAAIDGQRIQVDGGAASLSATGYPLRDGRPHLLTFVSNSTANTLRFFVDGVFREQFATSFGSGFKWGGTNFLGAALASTFSVEIYVQQITVFIEALTDAKVLELYNASCGKIVESTTTSVARYLDNVGWPSAWRDLAPTTGLGAARGECSNVQRSGYAHNALNVCAATEQGRYFAKKDGSVAFYGRYYAFEVTRGKTVQATFSDDGAGINYTDTGLDWSDREVNNDITVTWSGDPAKRSTDSASITALSRQSKTINTRLSTGAQAADMAAGLVQWRKDMTPRTRGIVVQGGGQTTQWATLLGLEIGDRIRHEITPMGVGSQDGRDLTLEAIEWRISGGDMVATFYGSPIPTDVFVLDTSLLDTGRLGF